MLWMGTITTQDVLLLRSGALFNPILSLIDKPESPKKSSYKRTPLKSRSKFNFAHPQLTPRNVFHNHFFCHLLLQFIASYIQSFTRAHHIAIMKRKAESIDNVDLAEAKAAKQQRNEARTESATFKPKCRNPSHPPVPLPPMMSKYSQGRGIAGKQDACCILRKILRSRRSIVSPRMPPSSNAR